VNLVRILFLDIETLPHHAAVWGLWGQNVGIKQIIKPGRTTCAAWKWGSDKKVDFAAEWQPMEERSDWFSYKDFLKKLHRVLDEADIIVTYNGKRFDIPTLYKEFVQHDLPPPAPFHHIDLYQTARRQFRWASNKLDFVCQQLGLGSKVHHKGQELWTDVEAGCPKAQRVMEKYNRGDVILLERLYKRLLPWIKSHPSLSLLGERTEAPESPVCPSCGGHHLQHRGYRTTKTRRYKRFQCNDCGSWSSETIADKDIKAGVVSNG
jgi:DNA polymerase elongation subunit (family B)